MIYVGIIILVIGIVLIIFAQKKKKTQTELSKTKSLPISQLQPNTKAEIQGTVSTSQPMQTPFSKRDCVYYAYEMEREVQTTDQQGRPQRRWETVSRDKKSIPFRVRDQTGQIAVYPERANIDAQPLGEQFVRPGDSMSNPILQSAVNLLTGYKTRINERALLANMSVYIFGYVIQTNQGLVIQKGEGDFIISYKSEEEMEKSMVRSANLMTIGGIIAIIAGIALSIYALI